MKFVMQDYAQIFHFTDPHYFLIYYSQVLQKAETKQNKI